MQPVSRKQQLRDVKWLQESCGQHDYLTMGGANTLQTIRRANPAYSITRNKMQHPSLRGRHSVDTVEEKAEGSRWNVSGFSSPRWKEGNAGWEGWLAGQRGCIC